MELDRQFGPDAFVMRQVKYHLKKNARGLIVAVLDGIVVGYSLVTFRKNSKKARLYSICVADSIKGRGMGRQLLHEAEYLAAKHGAVAVTLEVSERNDRAKQMYDTNGYKAFGVYPDYYGDGSDALRMTKKLC